MEAVCPDVSQNLASLDTCHVMFLDVATTMLRKFYVVWFCFPNPFCVTVLLHSRKGLIPININIKKYQQPAAFALAPKNLQAGYL